MERIRVILYARVSTKEQAEEGYSLEQQLEALSEYADEQGYEVVDVARDPGYSGAKLERPGLDRVRDLVAAGGVDIVLAQDRDRLSRNPDHMGYLRYGFAKHGAKLRGLHDRGDDSPVGRLTDGILDQIAQYERAMIMDRVRRNKRAKALQGQVVGGHHVGYGYRYVYDADGKPIGYEVDESTMRHARRIFEAIAAGDGIRTVKDRLDSEFVPTPRGDGDKWSTRTERGWSRPFIKNLILSDLYRPHTMEELREMGVSETVLSGLGADTLYGVYRYDDIPVPIPDAGIDLATVEAARANVLSRRASQRKPSRAGGRTWELSEGTLRCGRCGRAMQVDVASPRGKPYFYYRCVGVKQGGADRCQLRTHYRAEEIEADVWDRVRGLYGDKELLQRRIREEFARKRAELSGPGVDVQGLKERLRELDRAERRWNDAYEADVINVAELKAHRARIDEERNAIESTLERVRDREIDLLELDRQERDILDRLDSQELGEADSWTPGERASFYKSLQLRVTLGTAGRHMIFPNLFVDPPQWIKGVRTLESSPPAEVPPDAPICEAVKLAHERVTGEKPAVEGVPYGADMRLFILFGGMPCVMYGAGDVNVAHAPDEHVSITELLTATKAVACLLVDWCR